MLLLLSSKNIIHFPWNCHAFTHHVQITSWSTIVESIRRLHSDAPNTTARSHDAQRSIMKILDRMYAAWNVEPDRAGCWFWFWRLVGWLGTSGSSHLCGSYQNPRPFKSRIKISLLSVMKSSYEPSSHFVAKESGREIEPEHNMSILEFMSIPDWELDTQRTRILFVNLQITFTIGLEIRAWIIKSHCGYLNTCRNLTTR